MCCSSRRLVGRRQLWLFSSGSKERTAALLCLLALILSLTAPIVHMWEVAAARHTAVVAYPSTFSLLEESGSSQVLTAAHDATRSSPHDAALCLVCKGLVRIREWLLPQVNVVGPPAVQAWCHPPAVVYVIAVILHSLAPRAPPYAS